MDDHSITITHMARSHHLDQDAHSTHHSSFDKRPKPHENKKARIELCRGCSRQSLIGYIRHSTGLGFLLFSMRLPFSILNHFK